MKIKATERGFPIAEFKDRYDVKCSIQKSSLAFEDCIWLGVDDPCPQIMMSDAIKLGLIKPEPLPVGWIDYEIPKEVLIRTRMHLTQKMVKDLLPILQRFVETGEIQEL